MRRRCCGASILTFARSTPSTFSTTRSLPAPREAARSPSPAGCWRPRLLAASERACPSDAELRELWERQEASREQRERGAQWRRAREGLRRSTNVELRPAGLRRLDVAADLWTDSSVEGLALLECVAGASLGASKLAAYRSERCVESVLVKTRAGRTTARVYDKGGQSGAVPRGRWLRFEAQWRLPREARPAPEGLDGVELRRRFKRRFEPLWQAAGGISLADPLALAERVAAAVASGQLAPSRARSLAGYLLLSAAGMPQGARRTTCELERECRELGLAVVLDPGAGRRVDVAEALDQCADPGVWGAESA